MIGASRRRLDDRRTSGLTLHRRLARSRDRHRKLTLAAALALIAALVTWFLGLDLEWRAAATLVSFILALLVPVASSERWALTWIGEQAGLSYETALEYGEKADPYGLASRLEESALATAARVEEPRRGAWYLPLIALALGALLLPALSLPGSGTSGGAALPPGSPPPGASPVAEDPTDAETSQPQLPEDEQDRGQAQGQPDAAGGEGPEAESVNSRSEQESRALDRFLDNLRERPEVPEEEEQGDGAGGAQGQPVEPRGGEAERRPGDPEGEGVEERDDGAGEEQGRRDEPGNENGDGAGDESQDGQGPSQNPFSQMGEGEDPQPAGEQDLDTGAEQGEEISPGEDGNPAGTQSEDGEGDEQGMGQGAGGVPSQEQDAGLAEGEAGEELQLEGQLLPGPANPGGAIQLPGEDEVDLPAGRQTGDYRQEVERAVSEGRIPLEYQEIIRNYFR